MQDNLFVALQRRVPTPDRDPAEDYLTEAFAWLLNATPDLGAAFAAELAKRADRRGDGGPAAVRWRTQVQLGAGRVDMVGESDGFAYICEHKRWAPLGDDQMEKYRTAAAAAWPKKHVLALVTASTKQHTQKADVMLTWADVHQIVEEWSGRSRGGILVDQFLEYLRIEGLGPAAPVSRESIISYFSAQQLEPALARLFAAVARDLKLTHGDRLRAVLGSSASPEVKGARWGRLGIDFSSAWRPGLFVGVLLDGGDHYVSYSRPELGPDFVAIIDYHRSASRPSWEQYVLSDEFQALRSRLRASSGGFSFHDHLAASRQNRWHPLHLHRPLVEVLAGTVTGEEQRARMVAEIDRAVQMLLSGGELEALAQRMNSTHLGASAAT